MAIDPHAFDEDEATVRRNLADVQRADSAPAADSLMAPSDEEAVPEGAGSTWEQTVSRDVLVGRQLGDYVVKRRVGSGGMGIVYEGEHPVIGRKVAIKILRPDFADGGRGRDLVGEARAAAAIRHRGIIDIFGFGTIPGVGQYLVMEYLDGAPLDEVIGQRAPMAEAEAISLLDELLAALAAAHAVGVIHRDLKPGNVFVVKDSGGSEYVKVLDFGLAKRSEAPHGSTPQTRASMMVGTPEYMAPEQACGQAVSPQTDLYAVGVIAFEMLSRRLPFEGTSPMAIAIQHVQAKPPALSVFVDVHPALEALVMRLLEKEPADRPASAEAVRRELKSILRQLDGPAPTREAPSAPVPPTREAPRARTDRVAPGRPQRPPARPSSPGPRADSRTAVPTPGRAETRAPTPPGGTRAPPPAGARAEPRRAPARVPAPARPEPTVLLSDSLTQGRTAPDLQAMPTSIGIDTQETGAVRPNRLPQALVAAGIVGVLAVGGFFLARGGASHLGSPDVANVIPPRPLGTVEPVRPPPSARPEEPPASAVVPPTPAPLPDVIAAKGISSGTTLTASAVKVERGEATVARTRRVESAPQPGGRTPRASREEAVEKPVIAKGTLRLGRVKGWGTVLVDMDEKGVLPPDGPREYELSPGRHTFQVMNGDTLLFTETVTIRAAQETVLDVDARSRN